MFVTGAGLASLSWQIFLAGLGASAGRQISGSFRTATGLLGNFVVVALGLNILLALK